MGMRAMHWMGVLVLGVASSTAAARAQEMDENPEPVASERNATLADYLAHLQALETATAACAKGRNAQACDPALVGPDDRVTVGSGTQAQQRIVRYGWLRVLFLRAQKPDEAVRAQGTATKGGNASPNSQANAEGPSTYDFLEDAQDRLADDLEQADAPLTHEPSHPIYVAVLQQVLAGREFRRLKQPQQGETSMEKFNRWLNKFFQGVGKLQARAAWVGRALFWGFLLVVGVSLAWALLQMERRWRVRLVPESEAPAPGAASARDWQLWLNDARHAAGRGQWREAIHFLYWAAISRLESKKLWPADRARTPREYLALIAGDDPRKSRLGALTQEFERTWYGGRFAGESDYRQAEELATALFEGSAATGSIGGGGKG